MITDSIPKFHVYRMTYRHRNGHIENRYYAFCSPCFGSGTIKQKCTHGHVPVTQTTITHLGEVAAGSPEAAIQAMATEVV
jgi:hypothetical protein